MFSVIPSIVKNNVFVILNRQIYFSVILTRLKKWALEVNSPNEMGEVADEVRRKGGAPAEGVSKIWSTEPRNPF